MNSLPKDPMMLVSVINTKLRDYYPSLYALCNDLNVSKEEIIQSLSKIDYKYQKETNQFIWLFIAGRIIQNNIFIIHIFTSFFTRKFIIMI